MYLTWLDSNSWLIEAGDCTVLLDPWLVGPLVFSNLSWLFKGEKRSPRPIPDKIDLILLSQGLEDHAHPETLKQLDRSLPVVASPNAAKVVWELGYTQVTALEHGDKFMLGDRLHIQAIPGSPIGPFLTENGYFLEDAIGGVKLYYEPHGYHSPSIQELAPVDAVITPIISLKIPLAGPVINGKDSALQVCQWLQPQVIVPTAAGGDVEFSGLLDKVLQVEGSAEELKAQLAKQQLPTKLLEPLPGERFEIK